VAPRESSTDGDDLTAWISHLYARPGLLRMGHNQRSDDLNLGLGWLYYALGRILRPRHAVVIGSYRGFVPLVLAKALADNVEPGTVTLVDPSLVDDFWKEADVAEYAAGFGLENLRHHLATTQEFVETDACRGLDEIGILFVDGYHSAEQARFDYRAFESRLAPDGVALFHDSMFSGTSSIYGDEARYDVSVSEFIDELKRDPSLQVFDIPFGTGVTLVRKLEGGATEPFLMKDPRRYDV
jgi:predicted O-methyltransferase YrrM